MMLVFSIRISLPGDAAEAACAVDVAVAVAADALLTAAAAAVPAAAEELLEDVPAFAAESEEAVVPAVLPEAELSAAGLAELSGVEAAVPSDGLGVAEGSAAVPVLAELFWPAELSVTAVPSVLEAASVCADPAE
ncbi:hypothetical protein [Paenibacillus pinistramenti]|uniref:hypothetical protein n=1 Tax=Paenibacillus pinistramenti TaxID=1768003 RepID=UPI001EEFC00D|nr:hypothetical protein [Paenibacillus pinistramenti]